MNAERTERARSGFRNVHGRKPGRGVRPYLVLLKIVAISGFLGGTWTVLSLVCLTGSTQDMAVWHEQAVLIHRV